MAHSSSIQNVFCWNSLCWTVTKIIIIALTVTHHQKLGLRSGIPLLCTLKRASTYTCCYPLQSTVSATVGVLRWARSRRPAVFNHHCDICGKGFCHQISVALHRNLHRGATRCPICNVVFSRTYNMKRHIQFVHGNWDIIRSSPAFRI
jgi:hypothetical protein